jgi:RNA-binding protein 4
MPGRNDRSTVKIFVGNLPDRCPETDLRELFEQFGEVTECDVIKNFAFVHFAKMVEAENAVKGLNGNDLKGKNIRVEISEKVCRRRLFRFRFRNFP